MDRVSYIPRLTQAAGVTSRCVVAESVGITTAVVGKTLVDIGTCLVVGVPHVIVLVECAPVPVHAESVLIGSLVAPGTGHTLVPRGCVDTGTSVPARGVQSTLVDIDTRHAISCVSMGTGETSGRGDATTLQIVAQTDTVTGRSRQTRTFRSRWARQTGAALVIGVSVSCTHPTTILHLGAGKSCGAVLTATLCCLVLVGPGRTQLAKFYSSIGVCSNATLVPLSPSAGVPRPALGTGRRTVGIRTSSVSEVGAGCGITGTAQPAYRTGGTF